MYLFEGRSLGGQHRQSLSVESIANQVSIFLGATEGRCEATKLSGIWQMDCWADGLWYKTLLFFFI